jgi:hypothetical protein
LRLRRIDSEREVLAGLQREIFNDSVIQFVIGEFEKQLRERIRSVRSDVERKRQRRDVLRVEIDNLAGAVARGYASEALFENLTRREKELAELNLDASSRFGGEGGVG